MSKKTRKTDVATPKTSAVAMSDTQNPIPGIVRPDVMTHSPAPVEIKPSTDLYAEIERLKTQLAQAQAKGVGGGRVTCKVSEKGALSVYGLGRFPVTLYRSQWEILFKHLEEIKAFIAANAGKLTVREQA